MRDGNGRKIDYIRISVTDRCNLRCRYCMPEEGIDLMRHEDILTYQEILKIAETGARLGIRRVKVTGGEPLVRKGVSQLIRELNAIEGMEDVTLTTNGLLLGDMAPELAEAGLSSVNVSLDTLDPERFSRITRRDRFADVMKGIESAVRSGLKVKINCAVMEHLSREDVLAFAVRLKPEIFYHHKIFRVGLQQAIALRLSVQVCQVVKVCHLLAFTSSATASQAIPSPRPVKPSFSVVVALTLTSSMWQPRSSAINTRICGMCGSIFGA